MGSTRIVGVLGYPRGIRCGSHSISRDVIHTEGLNLFPDPWEDLKNRSPIKTHYNPYIILISFPPWF